MNIKQIIRECLNEGNSHNLNPDEIFKLIRSMPNKYRLKTKYGDNLKLYETGIDTALNNGMITKFYLQYLRNNKKTTIILPTPNLNPEPYEKLNELINLYGDENHLFKMKCFQMMNILLYEDYFNIDFRYGNGHEIIENLNLPRDEKEFYELNDFFNNKEGAIRHILFFADSNPIVRLIETY